MQKQISRSIVSAVRLDASSDLRGIDSIRLSVAVNNIGYESSYNQQLDTCGRIGIMASGVGLPQALAGTP